MSLVMCDMHREFLIMNNMNNRFLVIMGTVYLLQNGKGVTG